MPYSGKQEENIIQRKKRDIPRTRKHSEKLKHDGTEDENRGNWDVQSRHRRNEPWNCSSSNPTEDPTPPEDPAPGAPARPGRVLCSKQLLNDGLCVCNGGHPPFPEPPNYWQAGLSSVGKLLYLTESSTYSENPASANKTGGATQGSSASVDKPQLGMQSFHPFV